MKRLVYNPHAEAYIKTDSGIIDVTPYITSGGVERKLSQVSTATLTLRNPDFMFTNHKVKAFDGTDTLGPLVHPMDPIIITLTRLKDRPVQVFSGYVDKAPYTQLFPGTCTIEASCTLKRLQYTFFDPGLTFFAEFLSAHGWEVNKQLGISKPKADKADGTHPITDSSFGALLGAVLEEIGGWDKSTINIEDLPPGLVPRVAFLFDQMKDASENGRKDLETLLHKIIGTATITGGGGGGSGGRSHYTAEQAAQLWTEQGGDSKVADLMGRIAICESGGDPNARNPSGATGLWQILGAVLPGDLTDPVVNAKNAIKKYNDAGGTGPWVSSQSCWG